MEVSASRRLTRPCAQSCPPVAVGQADCRASRDLAGVIGGVFHAPAQARARQPHGGAGPGERSDGSESPCQSAALDAVAAGAVVAERARSHFQEGLQRLLGQGTASQDGPGNQSDQQREAAHPTQAMQELHEFMARANSGAGSAAADPYLLWSPIGTLVTWQMQRLSG